MLDGVSIVAEIGGNHGGVEPALRPHRVQLHAEFVVVERLVWFLSLDGIFGSQAANARALCQRRLVGQRTPSGSLLMKVPRGRRVQNGKCVQSVEGTGKPAGGM